MKKFNVTLHAVEYFTDDRTTNISCELCSASLLDDYLWWIERKVGCQPGWYNSKAVIALRNLKIKVSIIDQMRSNIWRWLSILRLN